MSEDETIYSVVANGMGYKSLWPADRTTPDGWTATGFTGTKPECMAWIEATWVPEKVERVIDNTIYILAIRNVGNWSASLQDDVQMFPVEEGLPDGWIDVGFRGKSDEVVDWIIEQRVKRTLHPDYLAMMGEAARRAEARG